MNISRTFPFLLINLFIHTAIAQDIDNNNRIQCKGETIPTGWAIRGYTLSSQCPHIPYSFNNAVHLTRLSSMKGSVDVCPGSQFQNEWVITRITNFGICGGNILDNTLTITKLDQADSIDACSWQPLPPPGWLIGRSHRDHSCNPSIDIEGYATNIYKIASQPVEFHICHHQKLPSNLVITASGFFSVSCLQNNAWSVVNLDKYSETELNICDGQTIPQG